MRRPRSIRTDALTIGVALTIATLASLSARADGGPGGFFPNSGGIDNPVGTGGNGQSSAQNGGGGGGAGTNGGAGGNASAAAGGAGGVGPGAAGNDGASGVAVDSGAGGGGGAHGSVGTALPGAAAQGGAGGNGGNANVNGKSGGGGGAGGFGAVVSSAGGGTLGASATGGNGGYAGAGGNGVAVGGTGGVGLYFTGGAAGGAFGIAANVTGGRGGDGNPFGNAGTGAGNSGGVGIFGSGLTLTVNLGRIVQGGNGGNGQFRGLGGIGIVGSNLTIDNRSVIAGGLPGTIGTNTQTCGAVTTDRACAIQFTGGINSVGTVGAIIGGINVASGSFQPALNSAPVGTILTIGGPLSFAPGTFYNVRITPTAADNAVVAAANLSGATVNVLAGVGIYAARQYTILVAGSLGGTTFAGVTSNLAFLAPTLSYNGNIVNLNIQAGTAVAGTNSIDYRGAAVTQNQFNVATGLTYGGILAGGNNPILTGFNQLTVPQAQAAFDSSHRRGHHRRAEHCVHCVTAVHLVDRGSNPAVRRCA